MADSKISNLPAATTPLAGTEVLPIVQSATTKKVSIEDVTKARAVPVLSLTSTNDSTINSLTVGKGGGNVASNSAIGAAALAANSTGANNTAVGYTALRFTTTDNNTALGYQAGYTNATGRNGTYIGKFAGYNSTGGSNTFVGESSGYSVTTGVGNAFIGTSVYGLYVGPGYYVTTGSYNTILGTYSGNNAVLDIRTANNHAVISDGAGNIKAYGDGSENWIVPTGNLKIGTSGKGIDFSAAGNAAGMTSELLADYEEGTFTPSLNFGGGTTGITYVRQSGRYTKIGNRVLCSFYISLSSKGSSTGAAGITGLPFTVGPAAGGENQAGYFGYYILTGLTGAPLFRADSGSTTISLSQTSSTTAANLTDANFTDSAVLVLNMQYDV